MSIRNIRSRSALMVKLAKKRVSLNNAQPTSSRNYSQLWSIVDHDDDDDSIIFNSKNMDAETKEAMKVIEEAINESEQEERSSNNNNLAADIREAMDVIIIDESIKESERGESSKAETSEEVLRDGILKHLEEVNLDYYFLDTEDAVESQVPVGEDDSLMPIDNHTEQIEEPQALAPVTEQGVEEQVPCKKARKRGLTWNRKENKKRRDLGQSYVTKNKTVDAKSLKPACDNCKHKCSTKISDEERRMIFKAYWSMQNLQQKREFIIKNTGQVTSMYPRISTNKKRDRGSNQAYYFLGKDGSKVRVCKQFFMATLDINNRIIQTVRQKKDEHGCLEPERRGGKKNELPKQERESIDEFIKKIPVIPSHYCRKSTSRVYVDGGKTVTDLYKDFRQEYQNTQIRYNYFYKIFKTYNISFFSPKKDQCEDCVAYNLLPDSEKLSKKEAFEEHHRQKELGRAEKSKDKQSDCIVLVYDLQAVMECPKGEASPFYYVSKLGVYNFTIVNIKTGEVNAYMWDETSGKRGAIEIGTCLMKYLKDIDSTSAAPVDVIFYSDNCWGQQKNQFIQAVYRDAVKNSTFSRIRSITHKYLIKGHTQNEGDAIHSVIERAVSKALKSGPIFHPLQYVQIVKTARKTRQPFNVIEMTNEDFLNIKELEAGPKLKISTIHVMRIEKDNPDIVLFKDKYDDEFKEARMDNRKKSARCKTNMQKDQILPLAYPEKLKVADKKKQGLLDLLKKGLIPKAYSDFYNGL